jgi:hypothetical protein
MTFREWYDAVPTLASSGKRMTLALPQDMNKLIYLFGCVS